MKSAKPEAPGRREDKQELQSVARTVVRVLRHGWWLVVLEVALVGAISGIQYLRAPRIYFAEQKFYVWFSPPALHPPTTITRQMSGRRRLGTHWRKAG